MSVDSDMIMVDGGSRKAYDMISVGNKPPEVDSEQNIETTFKTLKNGRLEVTIRRALDTGDFA